ncbi:hypothetical protein Tco_0195907 [Tanacetum coccineum]
MTSLRNVGVKPNRKREGILPKLWTSIREKRKGRVREAQKAISKNGELTTMPKSAAKPSDRGDFVYRRNEASHAKDSEKLALKWEGPYEVVEALRKEAYKLRIRSGNISHRGHGTLET